MVNALDNALSHIKLSIPNELIELAFKVREPHETTYPIEQMVLEKIIRGVVRKDANIVGGKLKKIALLRSI
jgi:hypothetical protein